MKQFKTMLATNIEAMGWHKQAEYTVNFLSDIDKNMGLNCPEKINDVLG